MKSYNVAVAGVTGNVGYEVCRVLEDYNFPVNNFYPIASEKSKNKDIRFHKKNYKCLTMDDVDFSNVDILFNAAGSEFASEFAEDVAEMGCLVIDKTSYFRMNSEVPLSVPEINGDETAIKYKQKNIISIPNCVAIPTACAIDKLNKSFGVTFANLSTYQSVSGAGAKAMNSLYDGTKRYFEARFLDKSEDEYAGKIPFNCIPENGEIMENGYTTEEDKIINEIKRLINPNLPVSATSVRVPVFRGHAISLTVGLEEKFDINDVIEIFKEDANFFVHNDKASLTHKDCVGTDLTYLSRIRKDLCFPNTISMYIVADNLRKGAAFTAVQSARKILGII